MPGKLPQTNPQIETEEEEFLNFAAVYVSDILIALSAFGKHYSQVCCVLEVLKPAGITVNLKKLKLHWVMRWDMPELGKCSSIQEFAVPKNLIQLQSFLGLWNYYQKFQQNWVN